MIHLVNSYPFEGWHSLQIYGKYVKEGLKRHDAKIAFTYLPTNEELRVNRFEKYYLKYIKLRHQVRTIPREGELVHLLDHAYAHLLLKAQKNVVTVHDLTHFSVPHLKAHQLKRWKSRMYHIKNADHIVAVSRFVADQIVSILGVDHKKVSVAYNDVNTDYFSKLKRDAYQDTRLNRETFDILSVGSVAKKKNLLVLLKAVLVLNDKGINVRLIRVGGLLQNGGVEVSQLATMLKNMGVLMELGNLTHQDVADQVHKADVVSFPSCYEGFGLPIVEAQAAGAPIVVADSSCLPEVAGEHALFHKVDCELSLAQKLESVYTQESMVEESVLSGLENIKRFRSGNHVQHLTQVYDELLSKPR